MTYWMAASGGDRFAVGTGDNEIATCNDRATALLIKNALNTREAVPQRMWVNQPSTLQPLHHLHGTRVLALHDHDNTMRIYFLSGDVISMQCLRSALSQGWPAHLS